jgi:hypothetical protein
MAIVYVVRPTEHNLALMRPLSLAGLFAAIAGTIMGFISMLQFVWTRELTVDTYKVMRRSRGIPGAGVCRTRVLDDGVAADRGGHGAT